LDVLFFNAILTWDRPPSFLFLSIYIRIQSCFILLNTQPLSDLQTFCHSLIMQHIHTYIRFWNPRYRFCNRAIFYLNLYFLTLTFLYTSNFVSIFTPISVLPFSHYRIIECAVLLFWVRTRSFLCARRYFLITEFVAFSVRDHLENWPIFMRVSMDSSEEKEKSHNSFFTHFKDGPSHVN